MRPPKPFTEANAARVAVIDAAIKRVGLKHLSVVHGVLPWSIHKWRNAGRIPNDHLEKFCRATGESPWSVCDPALVFMRATRQGRSRNATESGRNVKRVAGEKPAEVVAK